MPATAAPPAAHRRPAPSQGAGPIGYRASRNADGTYNIHDVPIYSATGDDERYGPKVTDRWLRRALARAQDRTAEGNAQGQAGYLPPSHVYHHMHQDGTPRETEPAGQFVPRRVGTFVYEGRPIPTLFADLVNMPPAIFALASRGLLPYRSVEVHPEHFAEENAEIDSLAYLPDEVPYLRLPMLRIGSIAPADATLTCRAAGPRRAVYAGAACFTALMSYAQGGATMADASLKDAPKTTGKTDDAPPGKDGVLQKAADSSGAAQMAAVPPAAPAAAPTAEPMPAWAQQMLAAIQQIAATLSPPAPDVAMLDGNPERLKEKGGVPAVPPIAAASAAHGVLPAQYQAQLDVASGRVAELEKKIREREAKEALDAAIAGAETKLAQYALGSTWRQNLRTAAAKNGVAGVDAYVTAVESVSPKLPGERGGTSGDGAGTSPQDTPAVAAYAAVSAEHGQEARRLLAERAKLPQGPARMGAATDEAYLSWQPSLRGALKPATGRA